MAEVNGTKRERHEQRKVASAAIVSGEIHQLPDGRAGYYPSLNVRASGDNLTMITEGQVTLPKTASIALLPGGKAYWDHSANKVHFKPVNDRDFFIGTVSEDALGADATCFINLNVRPEHIIELGKGKWTLAGTNGLGTVHKIGGEEVRMEFDAVIEAALASLLSDRSFDVAANAIVEFKITIAGNGDDAALDINVGIANAGHATDADSITESCFVHIDGNVLDILLESDDGAIEVAAIDSTIDYVEGTPFEVWMDMRDPADIQIYINGVLALPGTTFRLDAATGPLKALIHVEKTSNDTVGVVDTEFIRVRTMED